MRSGTIFFKEKEWHGIHDLPFSNEAAQMLLVFAERTILEGKEIYDYLKKSYPNANIVYCSSAGEINNVTHMENAAVCVVMQMEKTPIHFTQDNINNHQNSIDLGKSIAQQLPKDNLKYVMIIADGNLVNGDELIEGIQQFIPEEVLITGGVSGDGSRFEKTLVGLNDNVSTGNVVLMGLYGNHIKVGAGFKGGWDVYGPERTITKSAGNVLHEIDNENALDLYKKYLGKYAEGLPSSALFFPLTVKSSNDEFYVVRTILSIDETTKTMKFGGNLPEGATVRFMKSNYDRLVEAASDAGEASLHAHKENASIDLALIVSCVGRKLVLSNRIEEELEAAREFYSESSTVAGFFSYGEIAPQNNGNRSYLHNQTITITTFSETI